MVCGTVLRLGSMYCSCQNPVLEQKATSLDSGLLVESKVNGSAPRKEPHTRPPHEDDLRGHVKKSLDKPISGMVMGTIQVVGRKW